MFSPECGACQQETQSEAKSVTRSFKGGGESARSNPQMPDLGVGAV